MGTVGWALSAALSLIALQALTSPSAPARVSGIFAGAQKAVDRALNPNLPAIPDLRASAAASTT
ncbi:MAG: hypothetical protein BGO38_06950 [Cellulomonas sp. 73-145]|uniref:hypothetical protein n=1 Tax=Cellulomonas sp. 73-145 TaxID=1895739 RepID=UPI0009287456|nr:hypothetical protein [Cellulomonas sp. 73-145]OJV57954.1 MAG: hypothetical protein BGO38_06950 [Cellulomonas sp. 73-145]